MAEYRIYEERNNGSAARRSGRRIRADMLRTGAGRPSFGVPEDRAAGSALRGGRSREEAERRNMPRQQVLGSRVVREEAVRRNPSRQQAARRKAAKRRRRVRRRRHFCTFAAGVVLCLGIYGALNGNFMEAGLPSGKTDTANVYGSESGSGSPYAGGDTIGFEEELKELLERNEETRDYVQGYAEREKYLGRTADLSEDFVSGEVPLLMQWDRRWGYDAYGDSMIGLAGCGPLCLDMAYLYFTEDISVTPKEMAAFACDNGYYTEAGTSWALWTEGAAKLGLEGEELSLDEDAMCHALDAGGLIVCSMRPGDFTTVGHFILIRGYGEDGFYVNDPNRRSNSEKVWDFDTLYYQIKNLWVLRAGK